MAAKLYLWYTVRSVKKKESPYMKKIIAIAMAVLMLLSGVSCGSSKDKGAELDYLVLVNK